MEIILTGTAQQIIFIMLRRQCKNSYRWQRSPNNGDPVLAQNYLQHADHYLRRYNELSEKRVQITDRDNSDDKTKLLSDKNLEENLSAEMK